MKRVIFDTDIGIDDAMALLFLHRCSDVKIDAITTTFGNASVQTTTRNALYMCDKFAIHAPVYRGVAEPLGATLLDGFADFVHGKNGLGDIELSNPKTTVQEMPAAQAIVEIARANPHQISVVAVGRLTNIAMALELEPKLPELLKELVVMGGAFGFNGHHGNVSPVAEANVTGDPVAADRVFTAGFPLVIVGLDVTEEVIMDENYFLGLKQDAGAVGSFIYDISRFYLEFHLETTGRFQCPVHDSSAVAYLVAPHLFETRSAKVRVATSGLASGQTIQSDPSKKWPIAYWNVAANSEICTKVDSQALLDLYHRVISS